MKEEVQVHIQNQLHTMYLQFNFAGNADLVRFIKCIHEHGLWVNLRLGPYIAAEWNHG